MNDAKQYDPIRFTAALRAEAQQWILGGVGSTAAFLVAAADELDALRARADLAEGKPKSIGAELTTSLATEKELRAQLALVKTDVEGVWLWQGDRHDEPESLSCPVVMSADKLRDLVARPAVLAALVDDMKRDLDASRVVAAAACERASKAEAVAAAERALRKAYAAVDDYDINRSAGGGWDGAEHDRLVDVHNAAHEALELLGVAP